MASHLEGVTIKSLIEEDKHFDLISVSATTSVQEILTTLGKHRISAVPVFEDNKIIGCVDVLDLLAFAAVELEDQNPAKTGIQIREFANRNARDILNFSGRNPWNDLSYKAKFSELLDLLSVTNAHRVAITNEQIDVIGMITQSRIIRFFSEHRDKYQERLNKHVSEVFGKSERGVLSIQVNEFVITALKHMHNQKVSGLAIVDENGKLVGNISAGDLKNVDSTDLQGLREDLHSQIRSFKGIVSDPRSLSNLPRFDPVTVSPSSTLLEIVEKVLKHRIHRVFVVDPEGKPIQVISLGDLIKALK